VSYSDTHALANLDLFFTLEDHRLKLSKSFKIVFSNGCLHSLLPSERTGEVFSELRNPTKIQNALINTPEPKDTTPLKLRFFTLSKMK